MSADPDFLGRLRVDLVTAAERNRRRPRLRPAVAPRRLALAAAAVLVVAGLVATFELRTAPAASAGIDITHHDGRITVRLTDLEHRPAVIETALRGAGLDVDVTAGPAGPSRVGLFLADTISGPLPADLQPSDERNGSFPGFVLPEGWRGHAALIVGRPARAGENYVRFSDAYAKGEPLYCSGLYGMTAAKAAARLPKAAANALFETADHGTGALRRFDAAQVLEGPQAAYVVSDAIAVSPGHVLISITPDGTPPHDPPASPTRGACP